jgi:hypothetical protein
MEDHHGLIQVFGKAADALYGLDLGDAGAGAGVIAGRIWPCGDQRGLGAGDDRVILGMNADQRPMRRASAKT